MMTRYITLIFGFLILTSCTIKTKPIDYGLEHCRHCEMTIVDQNHAALYLTKKGKQFNFDAVECLIGGLKKADEMQIFEIKVTNYGHPKQLIDADKATYLISEGIKSPMGANLSAFASKKDATKAQQEYGGKLFTWAQIKKHITY